MPQLKHKARPSGRAFSTEITILLCVKVAAIAGIWALFFSHSAQEHVSDQVMVAHLMG